MRLTVDADIQTLLRQCRTIAIVGISDKPHRPSHEVAHYLLEAGYTIYPINPALTRVLGLRCYPDLQSAPGPIDLVDVFRRPEELKPVVDACLATGAKALWLQLGVVNEIEAARASNAGLAVVMDRCTKIEHHRLL